MKILLADNDPTSQFQIFSMLDSAGHTTFEKSADVPLAQAIANIKPELVLSVKHGPDANGVGAIEEARAANPALPLYILSEEDNHETLAADWYNAGATGYLPKEDQKAILQLLRAGFPTIPRLSQAAGFKTADNPVLLVDDEEKDRELNQRYLKRAGFQNFGVYSNIDDARAEVQANPHKYGLAFLDRNIPASDQGLTLAKDMRAADFQGAIYLLTGTPEDLPENTDREGLAELGLDGILHKDDFAQRETRKPILDAIIKQHRYHFEG